MARQFPNTKFLALEAFKLNVPVAPSDMDTRTGRKDSSSCITFFKSLGFDFTTQYEGRKVVTYTMIKEPSNVEHFRGLIAKVKSPKTETNETSKKTAKEKPKAEIKPKVVVPKKTDVKTSFKKVDSVKKHKKTDIVEDTFGTSGEVANSYTVDRDWDSAEGLNLRNLI